MRLECKDIGLVEHDVEPIEITGEAAHFHMIALPDNHHVVAIARQNLDGAMRDLDQRAGGFDHVQSSRAGLREGTIEVPCAVIMTVAVWTG